jgi:hypothetical protein
MAKFEIEECELDGKKTTVEAPGVVEAMHELLPWPTQQLDVSFSPGKGVHEVIDKKTDFKYFVRLV